MITFKPFENSYIEVILQMMQEFYAIDGYPIDPEKSRALFSEFIENEHLGKAWMILEDETPIGYVILTFIFMFEYQGKIAILDELYLTESARGKGFGSKTIDFIHAEARHLNLKIIYLEVEEHNEKAQKLYLANDFVFHHRKLMKYIVK